MAQRTAEKIFFFLLCLIWLTPLLMWRDLLYPFTTTKAFWLMTAAEVILPFYIYLLISRPELRPRLWKNPLSLAVLAFLAWNLLSSILGIDFLRSFWGVFERMTGSLFLAHLTLLYFYLLALGQMGGDYFKRFLLLGSFVAALAALYGLLVRLQWADWFSELWLPRVSSTFGNPIFFASFLILPMFWTLFFGLKETGRKKKLYLTAVIIQLVGIFLSGSRGAGLAAVAGLFLGLLLYFFLSPAQRKRKVAYMALAGIILFIGLLFLAGGRLPENSPAKRFFKLNDNNAKSRLVQWQIGLKGFFDRPFFGTGPENYYTIAEQHYRPELRQYDAAWFDKPHNYWLEVLATTGAPGLILYLAVLGFLAGCLWKGYKTDLLTLAEFCVLLAGFFAYQAQNLFVFDTISAGFAWSVFLGFGGFLWQESGGVPPKNKKDLGAISFAAKFGFAGTALGALAMVYFINWTGAVIAREVEYGHAYGPVRPIDARGHFERAATRAFNMYLEDSALEYSAFAIFLPLKSGLGLDAKFIGEALDAAIALQQKAADKHSYDPMGWMKLANLKFTRAVRLSLPAEESGIAEAERAIVLSPKRIDPRILLVKILIVREQLPEAKKALEELLGLYPDYAPARFDLAFVNNFLGQKEKAASAAEEVLAGTFRVEPIAKVDWLVEYYFSRGESAKALAILEKQAMLSPEDPQVFARLADAYKRSGQKDKAAAAARALESLDPASKASVAAFLKALGF